MKIEFHLEGPRTVAWFQTAVNGYHEALVADREEADARWHAASKAGSLTSSEDYIAQAQAANPQPAEAEKPKRTSRKAENKIVTGLKEAVEHAASTVELETAQITTSPEDRKPVEEIEEAEIVDVFEEAASAKVYTRDDVKAAMQVYVAKHGMDKLAANAADLLGAPKLSSIPEDPTAFEAAVKRLEAAVAG